ncbi:MULTISPECIES: SurA N-terminal domain-containing protein [unclassified Pseudactinotalea]|uniref:SurA N-terminal domain-containing protein n=1 Tax=unclassified Pseudactinotalea TaxID=2649176 RepID=UPI00128D600E|nr:MULTISPECIES: SurA N-terminal domain-containing protein [unclassified Pseudactinotalea]MPV51093.1 SurA [Pseudactinotalea sp. HY160]QGH70264.1 SurA [Pseudactinotalea sp. HY158]
MRITRSLLAASVAAVIVLAGCSPEADGGESPEASESASAGATDGSGENALPEADLDGIPDVVAQVNDTEISSDDFVPAFEARLQQAAQQGGEIDQDLLKLQVADLLVDNELLMQASADIEVTDADIDSTLAELAAQFGMGSADEVIAAFTEQGMTEQEIRDEASSQFRVGSYLESEVSVPEPTEEELRELYDAVVAQMGESTEEIPTFEETREQLASQATSEKQNTAIEGVLAKLRDAADVTINL